MATFRRSTIPGGTWFFTVATYQRQAILTLPDALDALRNAIQIVRNDHPFEIVAWVVLPDHMHAIWRLPEGDAAYPLRWALIKRLTAQNACHLASKPIAASLIKRGEIGFWRRRYSEHQIRDDSDLSRHIDYVHYNPGKHRLAMSAADWPNSTFHRHVKRGLLPDDWAAGPDDGGFGE